MIIMKNMTGKEGVHQDSQQASKTAYEAPKVERMPLDEVVKAGIANSSDGIVAGRA
jgi:hypothetical protein